MGLKTQLSRLSRLSAGVLHGKKGFLLTLLALLLSTLLALMFSANISNPPDYKMDLVQNRITILNYYVESFYDYAEQVTVVSGYTALQGMVEYIDSTGHYQPNFRLRYPSCIKNGTVIGNVPCPGMDGRTLEAYLYNLSEAAGKELKLASRVVINNITVSQDSDPFALDVHVNLTLFVSDKFANITATRAYDTIVPIIGVRDPIFLIDGTYSRIIRKTNITKLELWNSRDLEQMYNEEEYRPTKEGVSFIHRLEGEYVIDDMGIESYVLHTLPEVMPLVNASLSMVDYLFWNKTSFDCESRAPMEIMAINQSEVPSIPTIPLDPPFQLDADHWSTFNLSSAGAWPTC
ncbi:hypothetical protein JW826_05990 [Candidatus Woesearchaeota archaeon]|nr:hypothetical protein [Candidatus Woesearchaeota archaeon]